MEKITEYLIRSTVNQKGVAKAWEEEIMLPTYEAGEEEKNPIFLEKRVYQGSTGSVYPYPVVESVSDVKKDKPYRAFFLENEYLKIMILPEIGGRVQMAYDKVKKRHFVYCNQVIKPALVGLTGPWISGGIEFNWPQHHRPSTFLPTESIIEENPDGSVTVWCNEVERMFRTKGMQGFTLHPRKAYLEIKVKIYNRTPFPQTFLWWANPAVVVNDDYHSVFPPDVHTVFDHGKRDVSNFPIATGTYYKHNYSAGVDISKYKNIPVPTSYMAIRSDYDFVGGYNKGEGGGLLHVADHHISPGKKQWTWGNGDFGKAWDLNLTDEDGPYIELMTGVYTDNQPDFSWLQPFEEKTWSQYFMPYAEVGYVKNATKEAIVNLEVSDDKISIKLYTTSYYKNVDISLSNSSGKEILSVNVDISPENPYCRIIDTQVVSPEELQLTVKTAEGKELVSYKPEKQEIKPAPDPAKAAKLPEEISSTEQLFLTGLHLEQYRHATYNPIDYYCEALKREPGNVRCNNAMGLLMLRRGQFEKAEKYFRKAVETLTERNPNPYEGEPYYNLGLSLVMQNKPEEGYEALHKAVWNAAWQDAGYYMLAQLDTRKGNLDNALDKVEKSLIRNWHNHRARQLKASILRKLGLKQQAEKWIYQSLEIDPFNIGCLFERYLLSGDSNDLAAMNEITKDASIHPFIEYALDFTAGGFYSEAEQLLLDAGMKNRDEYPMAYYLLGYISSLCGNEEKSLKYYKRASEIKPDKCFPNRIEEVNILRDAIIKSPDDAKAYYYLGNFFYAARQYEEAIENWEKSASLDNSYPTVYRNLSLAYYNKLDRKQEAVELLEKAFQLDPDDPRIYMELDQLYKKIGVSPTERKSKLDKYPNLVGSRDDLYIESLGLLNLSGQYGKALENINNRKFHPWEGGEGKITAQFIRCRVELTKAAYTNGNYKEGLRLLHETDSYPQNLGEGKLSTTDENEINYLKGIGYKGIGDGIQANNFLMKATIGSNEPQQAFFYNDPQPDSIYFQGLAWEALGDMEKSRSCFNKLIDHGKKHLFDKCKIDYFAVSLPELSIWEDDLDKRNRIHCYYVMALGYNGLKQFDEAVNYAQKILESDPCHTIQYHINL
ncbi:MAG: DUF5107 domain-containing protein [Rikenellaceae bacterium]|nr:DUF5107 domain-containing protein [Rikenellaceae bacterium]